LDSPVGVGTGDETSAESCTCKNPGGKECCGKARTIILLHTNENSKVKRRRTRQTRGGRKTKNKKKKTATRRRVSSKIHGYGGKSRAGKTARSRDKQEKRFQRERTQRGLQPVALYSWHNKRRKGGTRHSRKRAHSKQGVSGGEETGQKSRRKYFPQRPAP